MITHFYGNPFIISHHTCEMKKPHMHQFYLIPCEGKVNPRYVWLSFYIWDNVGCTRKSFRDWTLKLILNFNQNLIFKREHNGKWNKNLNCFTFKCSHPLNKKKFLKRGLRIKTKRGQKKVLRDKWNFPLRI